MKIVSMARRQGKTLLLAEKMITPGNEEAIYLAASTQRARFAFEMAVELAEKRDGRKLSKIPRQALERRFISVTTWLGREKFGRARAPLYVDDLDDVIVAILGDVTIATLTPEEKD